jgi:hypothetical protein
MISSYGDVLSGGSYAPIIYREADIAEAGSRRRQFLTFMSLRGNFLKDDRLSLIPTWLDKQAIDPQVVGQMLIGLTGEDAVLRLPGKFNKTGIYLLFPYMQSPWRIAGFRVLNVRTDQCHEIHLEPTHHSFFGLTGCGHLPVNVHTTDAKVCVAYSTEFIDALRKPGHVFVHTNPAGTPNDFQLPIGILPAGVPFAIQLSYRRAFRKLYVPASDGTCVEMPTHIVQEFSKLAGQADVLGNLQMLLIALKNDRGLQVSMEDEFRLQGRSDLSRILQQHMDAHTDYQWKKFDIEETTGGYLARSSDKIVPFTNFLIHVDHALIFPENLEEIFYVARIFFAGKQYPIQFRRKSLNRTQDIIQLAIAAVVQTEKKPDRLPAFTDSTYRPALNIILDRQIAEASTVQGISTLGWLRDRFVTPGWFASPTDIDRTSRMPHPNRRHFLQFCIFLPLKFQDQKIEIPPSAWTAISLTVGMMLRSYLRAPVGALMVSRDEVTTQIFQSVLFGLDQKEAMRVSYTSRHGAETSFEGMNGFPCLASCPHQPTIAAIKQPCFMMSDNGLKLGPSMTQVESIQTARVARLVFQHVCQNFLR